MIFGDFLANFGILDGFVGVGSGRSRVDLGFSTVFKRSEPPTTSPDIIDQISEENVFHDFLMKKMIF